MEVYVNKENNKKVEVVSFNVFDIDNKCLSGKILYRCLHNNQKGYYRLASKTTFTQLYTKINNPCIVFKEIKLGYETEPKVKVIEGTITNVSYITDEKLLLTIDNIFYFTLSLPVYYDILKEDERLKLNIMKTGLLGRFFSFKAKKGKKSAKLVII